MTNDAPEDIAALRSAMGEQADIRDQCLTKANAIVHVLSQSPAPPVDLHDDICTVLWAVSDMLYAARAAIEEEDRLERRYILATDPEGEQAAKIRRFFSKEFEGDEAAD